MPNKDRDLTKKPLTPKQLVAMENAAAKFQGDGQNAFLLMRYAGLHPRVIFPYDYCDEVHIKEYGLKESIGENGRPVLVWNRPKKSGAKAHTTIRKHPAISFDVDKFIRDIRARASKYKRSTLYAARLIKEIGVAAGVPNVSPLSLRHSLAVELKKGGMPITEICDTLNIAPSTLRTYGRYLDEDRHDAYDKAMGLI